MKKTLFLALLSFCILLTSCGKNESPKTAGKEASDSVTIKTAEDAYLYCFSLVVMDVTRRKLTNAVTPGENAAPVNQFANKSSFPDYTFTEVVRPNADTYYSSAFCDLSKEPLVLSIPNSNGRYYLVPMLDAYTNVFADPGSRTTGNDAGDFLVTGPGWTGTVPTGIKEQYKAPTNMIWIIARIQCNGKEDGEKNVIPFQKKLKLTPLSSWGKEYTPPQGTIDPNVPAKEDVNKTVFNMPIDEFFNYANKLMVNYPPKPEDKPAMDKFKTIGVGPGAKFDLSKFDATTQATLKSIPKKVNAAFDVQLAKPHNPVNGWNLVMKDIGTYGTNYPMRAFVSYVGLGANLPKDALYPSNLLYKDGKPYNGANKYVLHFDKDMTPPVEAFWSLTMYDKDGYFIENPINRYAVGHEAPFVKNADGSIDIYIQNESPGKDKENNWLPAPKDDFNVMLRFYWPKESILNETWKPPAVEMQ